MAYKSNENPQSRGFFWAPSGDDRQSGKTRETAKEFPQSAIDASMGLIPPPSGPMPALVTASQGGASNTGFILEEGIAFTAEESSFIVSQDIGITMASSLSCSITTIVNLQAGSDCVIFDGVSFCAFTARFMGVNGLDATGLNITGSCDDLFSTISQMTISGEGSTGISITASSPTPIDINMNTVVCDGDNVIFFDYDPASASDIAVISVSSVIDNGSTGVTGFIARGGSLILEISGLIDCETAIRVQNGAVLDIFDAMLIGDIIVEPGGTLNCRILSHTMGTVTNNGTINGVINEVRYGAAIVSDPLSTVVYADIGTDSTTPDGSINHPFVTIQEALDSITDASSAKHYTILAAPGEYTQGNTTLKPFISIECIGTKRELILNGDITIDTMGEYVLTNARINGNVIGNLAPDGLVIAKFDAVDVLGTFTIDGAGAGTTNIQLNSVRFESLVTLDNCSTFGILINSNADIVVTGSAGNLDSDGNASRFVAQACQFDDVAININGPLQSRSAFFGSNLEGIITGDGSLTQLTFDSVSYPQNIILVNSATQVLNSEARGTKFDPSTSILTSDNVQAAIDELAATDLTPINRSIIISASSTASTQEPGATDTPLQIEFGPFQATTQFDLSVGGVITCNVSGQYDFQLVFHVGRTGSASFSEVYIRLLVNGSQLGQSAYTLIDDDDTVVPLEFFSHLTLIATDIVTFEIVRDSNGDNTGGLFEGDPTLGDWNDAPTAAVIISQLAGVAQGSDGDVSGGSTSIPEEIVRYDGLTGKVIQDGAGVTIDSGNFQRTTTDADMTFLRNGIGKVMFGNGSILGDFGASEIAGATTFSIASPLGFTATVNYEHNGSLAGTSGFHFIENAIALRDTPTGKGIYIETDGQISLGDQIIEPDFSVIVGSFTNPLGLPQLNNAAEGAISGRPRMIHYNSILESIRYWNQLDNEFQSLMSAPSTAQIAEIPTFAITNGHRLEANSDVSILAGVMQRISTNQGFRINRNGTGVVQAGAGNVLGNFGVAETTGSCTFSIATNDPIGSTLLSFEQNSTVQGIIGHANAEDLFGMTTVDGGGVFIEGGRTFVGIAPLSNIPLGVALQVGSTGINSMMIPILTAIAEFALTGVEGMFHYNTTSNVPKFFDGVSFRSVAAQGAMLTVSANSTPTPGASLNSWNQVEFGGSAALMSAKNFIKNGNNELEFTGEVFDGVATIQFDWFMDLGFGGDTYDFEISVFKNGSIVPNALYKNPDVDKVEGFMHGGLIVPLSLVETDVIDVRRRQLSGGIRAVTFVNLSVAITQTI